MWTFPHGGKICHCQHDWLVMISFVGELLLNEKKTRHTASRKCNCCTISFSFACISFTKRRPIVCRSRIRSLLCICHSFADILVDTCAVHRAISAVRYTFRETGKWWYVCVVENRKFLQPFPDATSRLMQFSQIFPWNARGSTRTDYHPTHSSSPGERAELETLIWANDSH